MSAGQREVNIELFPCSGGMAEGFRRAGVVFDLAFDKDPEACESYAQNHGHRPIQMDVRDLVRMARAGWRPAERVRLLVADPPVSDTEAVTEAPLVEQRQCLWLRLQYVDPSSHERWRGLYCQLPEGHEEPHKDGHGKVAGLWVDDHVEQDDDGKAVE